MSKTVGGLCRAGVILLASASAAWASEPLQMIQEKLNYEHVLERKVETIIQEILGPNKAKVIVNVDMDFSQREQYRVIRGTGTKWNWANAAEKKDNKDDKEAFLMPGFAMPELERRVSAIERDQKVERSVLYPAQLIKKMRVTVVLNEKVGEGLTASLRDTIAMALSIDPARGDALTIVRTHFNSPLQNLVSTPESLHFVFKYVSITFIILICLATLAYSIARLANAMVESSLGKQVQEIAMDFSGQEGGGAPGPSVAVGLSMSGALKPAGGPADAKEEARMLTVGPAPFRFASDEHRKSFPYVLRAKPVETIALVLPLVPDELSSQVLANLPEEKLPKVVLLLSNVNGAKASDLEKMKRAQEAARKGMESDLEAFITVNKTLLRCPESLQYKVLNELRLHNAELAESVEEFLVKFEDVAELSEDDFGILLSQVPFDVFAKALSGMEPEFVSGLMRKLHEGTQSIIREHMKYSASTTPAERVEMRTRIVERLSELRRSKKITLQKKQSVPPGAREVELNVIEDEKKEVIL